MILFIDIETIPTYAKLLDMPKSLQKQWRKKAKYLQLNEENKENEQIAYRKSAGIFAEWSRVLCIGLAYFDIKTKTMRQTVLHHESEKELLLQFQQALKSFLAKTSSIQFCGHNIKEFDLPFICRRMIVHKIPLLSPLNLSGLKPWENQHIDTMELWRFGDYKRYVSLELLALCLGIDSPKDDIDGSMVADIYFEQNGIEQIKAYCAKDVITTAKVYYRLIGKDLPFENIIIS